MSKHILVCLPISAEQRTRIEAVQGFAYRFTTPDTATVEDALWADAVLGNLPVPLIRQNDHLEWFQSNTAGPNNYLEPGVLPEKCIVTNATGAYGLAISECMLAMWLSLLKELPTYRDNQREHRWAPTGHSVGSIAGSRVLCVGMGDIGSNFARRAYALGAEVVGVRRTVHPDTPCPDYCTRVVAQSALDAELPQADLVALSLPGTPETLHLFSAERLGALQARCYPAQCGARHCRGRRGAGSRRAQRAAFRCRAGRDRPRAAAAGASSVGGAERDHHAPCHRRLQPAQDAGQYRGYFCTQPQALCRRSAAG